jgi:antitoxin component of MazEF toxin-antitoxin module
MHFQCQNAIRNPSTMPIETNPQTQSPEKKTLDELLAQITPENRHEELAWGKPVGSEIW